MIRHSNEHDHPLSVSAVLPFLLALLEDSFILTIQMALQLNICATYLTYHKDNISWNQFVGHNKKETNIKEGKHGIYAIS